jgi:hypothetical protein
LEENFSKIGDFIRGLVGADPSGEITEMFEAGMRLRTALQEIGTSLGNVISRVQEWFSTAGVAALNFWNGLPVGVRTAFLVLLGIIVLPHGGIIAGIISIATLLDDPSNIWGWLTAAGVIGVATVGAPLTIALAVLVSLLGSDSTQSELLKWLTGQRQIELAITITSLLDKFWTWVLQNITGTTIKIDVTTRIAETLAPIHGALTGEGETEGLLQSVLDTVATFSNPLGAALGVLASEFAEWGDGVSDELVGNSIFPEMWNKILSIFVDAPGLLQGPLANINMTILTSMANLRMGWMAELDQMSEALQKTINLQQEALSGRLNASAVGASQAASTSLGRAASNKARGKVSLTLNAKETRRLMREGVYDGINEVF